MEYFVVECIVPAAVSKKEKCAKFQKLEFVFFSPKCAIFLSDSDFIVLELDRTLKRGKFSIMPELKLLQSIQFLCKGCMYLHNSSFSARLCNCLPKSIQLKQIRCHFSWYSSGLQFHFQMKMN